jgi:hypothetical protein
MERIRVFLSSTQSDLQAERDSVESTRLRPTTTNRPWTSSKAIRLRIRSWLFNVAPRAMGFANGSAAIRAWSELLAHVTPAMPPTPRLTRHGRRPSRKGSPHTCKRHERFRWEWGSKRLDFTALRNSCPTQCMAVEAAALSRSPAGPGELREATHGTLQPTHDPEKFSSAYSSHPICHRAQAQFGPSTSGAGEQSPF